MPSISKVHVLSPTGESFLNYNGTGHAVVEHGEVTQVVCREFNMNKTPVSGKEYIITGTIDYPDRRNIEFKKTLTCVTGASPESSFE